MKNYTVPIAVADKIIIEKINQKDKKAFDLLYQRYWNYLLRVASNYIEDEDTRAEIVQELFVHLYTTPSYLKIDHSLSSYLSISLKNKILNHLRKKNIYEKHIAIASEKNRSASETADKHIEMVELQKQIDRFIEKLPEKYKEVYILKKQKQFSIKKIAFRLNRPVDTVDKQFRKIKILFKNYFKR
ncbi:MAG TPA: sigma-70 family RNA polymerase sigma factor [Puia sp.]|nr:sigma-70 family RNA polymerase sigma factor [Puia sp.]